MPGWHEATKTLQADGAIQMIGIVQEQHPDRARLFMQWKEMGWPVLVDALNQLEVEVVPITMFIDEEGIIRSMRPPRRGMAEAAAAFAAETEPAAPVASDPPAATSRPVSELLSPPGRDADTEAWRRYGLALVDFAPPERLDEAVRVLGRVLQMNQDDGLTRFQHGVALRRRYESPAGRPGDFQAAIISWTAALDANPNQYIWRRRIQQYGPRLEKPYPFYDWVESATAAIRARGEEPVRLSVRPGDAEIARPARDFDASRPATGSDPEGRVTHDELFVAAEVTVVPPEVDPGQTVRVHVTMHPNRVIDAHWNNEAEPLMLWMTPPEGWAIDEPQVTFANASTAVSNESRTLEFELKVPADSPGGVTLVRGYALYNVCEGADATCLYRRKEVVVPVRVSGAPVNKPGPFTPRGTPGGG
ncbi:MAG: hypothetical protein HKN62_11830 [Phycisphaerales bacterium]|nr:hypothetical protein [Phycisphaerales bacterium]